MKRDEVLIARLFIEVSYYEREDLIGGITMPNLSLKPPPNFKPKYNAVDRYVPNFQSAPGRKANCFNFADGDIVPGFDDLDKIEVFPPKFKEKNVLLQS